MAQLRLTPELAKKWFKEPESAPLKWQKSFSKKRLKVLKSMAHGFKAKDSDLFELTANEFEKYATKSDSCSIYFRNEFKLKMKESLHTLENEFKKTKKESLKSAIKSLKEVVDNELDYTYYCDMHFEDYLKFYSEDKEHYVRFVFDHFFDFFTKAKKFKFS